MNAKKFFFYLLAVLLGGCFPVVSLHQLFTEKDVVFDEKLLGTWVQEGSMGTIRNFLGKEEPKEPTGTIWEFTRADTNEIDANKNAYRLIFSNKEGKKGFFVAHLLKLKDKLFLDVHLSELSFKDPNRIDWPGNFLLLIPAHTFIKIDSIDPNLTMRLTDNVEMKEFLKADPNAVKHEFLDEDEYSPVLTASTKELQAFVLKYADDSQVFTEAMVLGRKKTAEPNAPPVLKPKKPKM
ncbi:MAG: hypothetical protein NTX52_13985 [Planctomycetota bacterium]|nr:hypothetical protein [Planctomycetota bacterium]